VTRTGAVLILASDRVSRGERKDATAAGVRSVLEGADIDLVEVMAVPDEREQLVEALSAAAARFGLVLTSGGTGIGPRDVTPEATRDVLDREIPGLGELMRSVSQQKVPTAALSRALAGTSGRALIVNLPGSPKGAAECLAAVLPALVHGLALLAGSVGDCADDLPGSVRMSPPDSSANSP
jgi:molybdenum cofactor synthesis domain-containing protein